jgi:hypothetical protein
MAKQSNFVTFKGKMGGISFYEQKGKSVARKAGGPSKSKIMTSPKFERQRQNIKEFNAIAVAVKTIFQSLKALKDFRSDKFSRKIRKFLRAMLLQSDGDLGQREVLFSKFRTELRGLEMSNTDFVASFHGSAVFTHPDTRINAQMSVTGLDRRKSISAPPKATHFKLVQVVAAVPDIVYNALTQEYNAAQVFMNSHGQKESDFFPINEDALLDFTLTAALPDLVAAALLPETTVIQCVGIQFFEKLGRSIHRSMRGPLQRLLMCFSPAWR